MFLTVFYEGDNQDHVMKIKLYGMKTGTLVNAESELLSFVNNKEVTKLIQVSPTATYYYHSDVQKVAQTRNVRVPNALISFYLGQCTLMGGAYDVQLVEDYITKHRAQH